VTVREQMTLMAGLAVALSTSVLFPVFTGGHWFPRTVGAVAVVVAAGLVGRRLGLPRPLQPLLGLLALAGYLCVVFAGATLDYGVVPTGRTVDVLRALVDDGRTDISRFAPPVPTSTGLVLLSAAGVGAVAIAVDLLAVVLERAALAGVPLLVLFVIPSAVLPGGLGALPFVLGALGWLGLLLVEGSDRVGRWGTPMRSALPAGGEDSSLGRVGRRIGFAAVSLAVLVPSVVPGLDHRLVGGGSGSGTGPGDGGGSSQARTFNPITRLRDQLTLPKPVSLLIYRTDDPQPDYLRLTTLDLYNGSGWSASNLVADRESARVQDGVPKPVGDVAQHRDLKVKIAPVQDHLDVHWLPVPFGPTKVNVKGTWLWDPASQTVFSASSTTRGLPAYTVTASRVLPDRDVLARAEVNGIDPKISKQYGQRLQVTAAVQALTDRLVAGKTTEYDKALAIQTYFTDPRNGFVYDLRSSQPQRGQDPLSAFLTGKHGFCEQYATAMAVLLRQAGIPSRVAVGFTPGAPDVTDATIRSITTSDAHAWPEAWFAGTGWVRFEPTPAVSGSTIPSYALPPVTTPEKPAPNASSSPTPAPTGSAAPRTNSKLEHQLLDGNKGGGATSGGSGGPSPSLLVPAGVAVTLALPLLLTLVRRRRRWQHPGALTAWAQLQDDATDIGHRWLPSDSPRAAARRLAADRRLLGPPLEALERVAGAVERARYAPPGRDSDDPRLRADVATVRTALQDSAPLRVRLRALLVPSSTLTWAVRGAGDRLADALEAVDDAISAVTRPLRRRTASR
jgi:hypothetical protein